MRFDGLKPKIILTFSLLTIVLLSVMAYLSYRTARNSYERQSQTHTQMLCNLLAGKIETRYLNFIQQDPRNHANSYFSKLLSDEMQAMKLSAAFIFDDQLQIPVSVGVEISPGELAINRLEIEQLGAGESAATLPFKAADGLWYLWAFQRLSPRWYVGIQEDAVRMSGLDRLAYSFLLIGLAGLLLTIFSAVLITRSLTRPIDQLSRFSRDIGDGKFGDPPPPQMNGELKILRNALIQMRGALQSKQEEKEQMLAQIAHEIRNPLGGIELITDLLKEDISDKKQLEYLDKIQREVQGLKNQITDFLNYARPAQPHIERIDLPELSQEIEMNLRSRLQSRRIQLVHHFAETMAPFDRQHLKQVLLNLISNSIDATPEDGIINIFSNKNGSGLLLGISDNGCGIPDEIKNRVFDPFVTDKKDGAGLGLTICKKLCEQNRARLEITETGVNGTTIQILIDPEIRSENIS